MKEPPALEASVHASVDEIGREAWDGIAVARRAIPFLHHGFLSALEESGAVGGRSGWLPRYLAVRAAGGGPLLGVAATFVKAHSMGEFVYDWAWADAAERAGLRYYPKLVIAAPFSPVTGERLLVAPHLGSEDADRVRAALIGAAVELAVALGCSGVHLLFCAEGEVRLAARRGFVHRLGFQYHWDNEGYADFDAFLARFSSKRRNQIRRERRRVKEQGVEITCHAGADVPQELMAPVFDFYQATIARFPWGRRYLNRGFFALLWQRMRPYLQVTLARRGTEIVGGSLNLESLPAGTPGAVRYGRYWGALAEVDSLHFEVCAYAAIDDCIARGLRAFEAGAGGEEHKLGRGFLPHRTHSVHLLFEPGFAAAVSDFCAREAVQLERAMAEAAKQVFAR